MTGLAAILPLGGALADERELAPMLAAMGHPGAGAPTTLSVVRGAVGVLPFPADDGSNRWGAPLVHDPESGLTVLFDGRLDGRSLIASLGKQGCEEAMALASHIPPHGGRAGAAHSGRVPSDAVFVHVAWRRLGEDETMQQLQGPFALIVVDSRKQRVVLVRDLMGTRSLAYAFDRRRLIVASEDAAVASVPGVDASVDERTMAHYFALRTPEDGATFYRGVRDLRPGEMLSLSLREDGEVKRRPIRDSWHNLPMLGYRDPSDPEQDLGKARWLRDEIDRATRARIPGLAGVPRFVSGGPSTGKDPFGVTLSGGLDSSSIAAFAAAAIAPRRLSTFSYVFDELSSCDERLWMDPLVERWHLDAFRSPADQRWPLRDGAAGARPIEGPETSPYQDAMDAVYAAAAQAGVSVLLAGAFGDHLYTGAEYWMADLWSNGRRFEAIREAARHVRRAPGGWRVGLAGTLRSRSMRLALQRVGRRYPPRHSQDHPAPPPWLTDDALRALTPDESWPPDLDVFRRPEQARAVLGVAAGRGAALSRAVARRHGVALRLPYRDEGVAALMLLLPGYLLYHHGRVKDGLRLAMGDLRNTVSWLEEEDAVDVQHYGELLPPIIRDRATPTDQRPLYHRGVFEREHETVRRLLERPDARWREFVRPEWLAARVPPGVLEGGTRPPGRDPATSAGLPGSEREQAVVWRCITAELWRPVR